MFDNSSTNLQTRTNVVKIQVYNNEDKENINTWRQIITNKNETENSAHTPLVILKKNEKETSPFKRNLNTTDYTINHNLSHYSEFKFCTNSFTKENPFQKLDLDYYNKNFTSPKKNNVVDSFLINKPNTGFTTYLTISSVKDKPKLTQSESRQMSLLISKQKNSIIKEITNEQVSKNIEKDNERNINSNQTIYSINKDSKTKLDCHNSSIKNKFIESKINSKESSILSKSVLRDYNNNLNSLSSFLSDSAVLNHPISCSSFSSKMSNINNFKYNTNENGLFNQNLEKKINQITEFPNEVEESDILNSQQDFNQHTKSFTLDLLENDKNLLISKERKNDEVYKLLKIKKNVRKPEVSVNSSARKISDMKKYDDESQIDDVFDFNILSRKKKVHSVKKVFVSEIKLYNAKLNGYKTFKIFRDSDIGINQYWQSHLISTEQDDDVESDDEQIEMAYLFTLDQLRSASTTIINKGEECLRNEEYITKKTSNFDD